MSDSAVIASSRVRQASWTSKEEAGLEGRFSRDGGTAIEKASIDSAEVGEEYGLMCRPATVRAFLRSVQPKSQLRRVATYRNSVIDEGAYPATAEFWQELSFDHPDVHAGVDERQGVAVGTYLCVPEKRSQVWRRIRPRVAASALFWVRERWQAHVGSDDSVIVYAYGATDDERLGPWRTADFIPRGGSRINLQVTNTRVERLRDISETDVLAEGLVHIKRDDGTSWFSLEDGGPGANNSKDAFASVWAATEGSRWWDRNPHVWVYDLKMIRNLQAEKWRESEISRLLLTESFHQC